MKKSFIITMGLIILSFLNAQNVTLEEAINLGLKNNLDIKASQSDLQTSQNTKYKAYSALLPTVTASTSTQKFDNAQTDGWEDQTSVGIQMNQPVFQGGKIIYGIKIADNTLNLSEISNDKMIMNTIAEIETAYYNFLSARSALEIGEKELENLTKQLEISQIKYESGSISETDLLQVQVEKSQKENNKISLENALDVAIQNFHNSIGDNELLPEEINIEEVYENSIWYKELSDNEIDIIIMSALKILENQNPDLKILKIQTENAKSQLRMSQVGFLPSISFGYNHNWSGDDYSSLDDTRTLSLNFSKSLSLGTEFFAMKEYQHKLKKAQYTEKNTLQSLEVNLKNQIYNLISSAKNLNTLKLTLEQTEKLNGKILLKYQTGTSSVTDMLDSAVKLYNSKSQYNNGIYKFLQAKTSLKNTLNMSEDIALDKFLK